MPAHSIKHNLADPAQHDVSGLSDGYVKIEDGTISTGQPTASVAVAETPITLLASGWTAVDGGYEQTVDCNNDGLGIVGLSLQASDNEYYLCRDAEIRAIARTASTITFRAISGEPTADIRLTYREEKA